MADVAMDGRGVDDHEADTERAAVWRAANSSYEASDRAGRQDAGSCRAARP